MKIKNCGFSLVEVLVVLAIISIIAVFVIISLGQFSKEKVLEGEADKIIRVLRLAQSKTLASEGKNSFGVHFDSDKFIFFKGEAFIEGAPDNEINLLPADLEITEVNFNEGNQSVVFARLTGMTANQGSAKIRMIGDNSKNKVIFVDSSGTVNLSSWVSDDSARIKDSRHAHFLFSLNTKISTTLTLSFPEDGYSENINYQNYLNADKTQFDWERTISVAGSNQRLKIHSLFLTDAGTIFSVHRDRRYNSKALSIFLDGENLLNYSAGGVLSSGTSVFVAPAQPD